MKAEARQTLRLGRPPSDGSNDPAPKLYVAIRPQGALQRRLPVTPKGGRWLGVLVGAPSGVLLRGNLAWISSKPGPSSANFGPASTVCHTSPKHWTDADRFFGQIWPNTGHMRPECDHILGAPG